MYEERQIERRQQRSEFVCSACGADRGCNCNAPALTRIEKREITAGLLKENPEKSDRQIAEMAKASPTTVGTIRAEMEEAGEVSKLDTRIDAKGIKQPATRKPSKKAKAKRQEHWATRKARERDEALWEAWRASHVADETEAKQLATDAIALDRDFAHRLHAHLVHGWLKDALRRGLGLEGEDTVSWITPPPAQSNDADARASAATAPAADDAAKPVDAGNDTDPEQAAEQRKQEFAELENGARDGSNPGDISACLWRQT